MATDTNVTTDARVERTREIHAELMALWGVSTPYNVGITVFPPRGLYDEVEAPEISHETNGQHVTAKRVQDVGEGWHVITIHRLDGAS